MKPWMHFLTGLFSGLIAAALLYILIAPPRGNPVTLQPEPTRTQILVHIEGEIAHPGVYRLSPDSRVQDAVQAAGGLTAQADTDSINLAGRLQDGQKIIIPARVTVVPAVPGTRQNTVPNVLPTSDGRIDLNQATLEQLDRLPGIGENKARSIIEYREKNGPFKTTQDIMKVPGIGQGIYETVKELIFVATDQP